MAASRRFRKWHFLVLAFQIATFVPLTWLVATMPAGGLYSIWQNIINSLELYEQSHRTGKRINKH